MTTTIKTCLDEVYLKKFRRPQWTKNIEFLNQYKLKILQQLCTIIKYKFMYVIIDTHANCQRSLIVKLLLHQRMISLSSDLLLRLVINLLIVKRYRCRNNRTFQLHLTLENYLKMVKLFFYKYQKNYRSSSSKVRLLKQIEDALSNALSAFPDTQAKQRILYRTASISNYIERL